MSTPAPAVEAPRPFAIRAKEFVTPFLAPYYLTIFGLLGALTTGFVVVILLLILVAANFNLLGWTE
jgi:hypothetical protein